MSNLSDLTAEIRRGNDLQEQAVALLAQIADSLNKPAKATRGTGRSRKSDLEIVAMVHEFAGESGYRPTYVELAEKAGVAESTLRRSASVRATLSQYPNRPKSSQK